MANSKKAELHQYRELDNEALKDTISNEELAMKKLRFSHAVNPIENPLAIRLMRRQIARLKTEDRKRQLGF